MCMASDLARGTLRFGNFVWLLMEWLLPVFQIVGLISRIQDPVLASSVQDAVLVSDGMEVFHQRCRSDMVAKRTGIIVVILGWHR